MENNLPRVSQQGPAENAEYLESTLEGLKSLRYQQSFGNGKPWLDDSGRIVWSSLRIKTAKLVFSQGFETTMGVIIVSNLILIMIEADRDAMCYPEFVNRLDECIHRSDSSPWISVLNFLLLLIYSGECLTRFFVERSHYWCNSWNMIDLVTVLAGWFSFALASVVNLSVLRLSRLVRVVRAVRVFISVPEFYLLMTGLYSSIKAILFGSMMLLSVLLFFAVLAVEMIHPANSILDSFPESCDRCPRAFASVSSASITFFQQIVAGDSWGTISVPLLEAKPWTGIILFLVFVTVSLGLMNLILAVIVERASEARDNDHDQKVKKKQEERSKSMFDLAKVCATMDKNNNGLVSLEEMRNGYDQLESFRKLMQQMDIRRDEMETIFKVLDDDNSGEVSYLEFCQNIGGFLKRDPVIMHSLVHAAVLELRKMIREEVVEVMHEQHKEIMAAQNKVLSALSLPEVQTGVQPRRDSKPPYREHSDLRQDISDSISAAESSFEALAKMEKELQPLLKRAEAIAETLAESAWKASHSDSVAMEDQQHPVLSLGDDADIRFHTLCDRFQQQRQQACSLQQQLVDLVDILERRRMEMENSFHMKMFHV